MSRQHCSAVGALVGAMKRLSGVKNTRNRQRAKRRRAASPLPESLGPSVEPDWTGKCSSCGAYPVVPVTGMCGPCTFGEADTAGGEW